MIEFLAQIGRYGFDHMNGWGWVPGIVSLVFLALVVGLVVWLFLSLARRGEVPVKKSALTLLDERYARGELDREDYLQRRADLER